VQPSIPPSKSVTPQQSLSNDLIIGEQAKPKDESIEDESIDKRHHVTPIKSTQMGNEDYILGVLNDLPEQWIGKEMSLHVIADKKDATWTINRILQDIERGLINAQFAVEEYDHLCDITLILKIAPSLASFQSAVTAINPVFSFILKDIKSETISRRKRKLSNISTY